MKSSLIILLFIAVMIIYGCSEVSECEILMAELSPLDPSEFISSGCIDAKHAYFYPSDWPDLLVFASVSKDTFVTDSVVDFNHSFAKYANMEEFKQAMKQLSTEERDQAIKDIDLKNLKNLKKMIQAVENKFYRNGKYQLVKPEDLMTYNRHVGYKVSPVIYRKKDRYQLVADNGVYEISFQNKEFTQVLEFKRKKHGPIVKRCSTTHAYFYKKLHKAHFFPEYTIITSNFDEPDSSYIILYNNGEITVNIKPKVIPGYCLSVLKQKKEINGVDVDIEKDKEWEEIAVFGLDCTPGATIIKYDCISENKMQKEDKE